MPRPGASCPQLPGVSAAAAFAAALAALLLPAPAGAQYAPGSALFNASTAARSAELTAGLADAPELEDIFYPAKYRLPTDFYVAGGGGGLYTQNVVFDPCRQYGHACCNDTYGTPEFVGGASGGAGTAAAAAAAAAGEDVPRRAALRSDGSELPMEASRRPDDELLPAPGCVGRGDPHPDCVLRHLARRPFRLMPRCWNFNDSVVADRPCRSPRDGAPVALCMEVGYTQNALVVDCGGAHAGDPHCGTFLEVHAPGHAQVLAEARLPGGQLTSGYRMAVVTTTYQGAPNRVLCARPGDDAAGGGGRYELWWVQRTLHSFVLERRLPFRVVSPRCDWDAAAGAYLPWATVDPEAGAPEAEWTSESGVGGPLVGRDPHDPSLFVTSRERLGGDLARGLQGRGMGGTLVAAAGGAETQRGVGGQGAPWDDVTAYVYTPAESVETVRSGRLEPPSLPSDQARRR